MSYRKYPQDSPKWIYWLLVVVVAAFVVGLWLGR
jgi:hypothetical protein